MTNTSDKDRLSDSDREYCVRRLELGAYYYGFEPTGNASVDFILGAVSAAGKAFHHTSDWNDKDDGSGSLFSVDPFDAGSCVDLIQAAANEAANLIPAPDAELVERLRKAAAELDRGGMQYFPACELHEAVRDLLAALAPADEQEPS